MTTPESADRSAAATERRWLLERFLFWIANCAEIAAYGLTKRRRLVEELERRLDKGQAVNDARRPT